MRVIVIGAGEVGFDVARILSMEQHDVVVVDVDEEALSAVGDKLDVMTVRGSGTQADVLQQAGIKEADLLISVAAIDEVNIIACMVASRLGVKTTIARVRSGELTRRQSVLNARDLGIDLLIHPEESASEEIVRLIRRASATDVLEFIDGRVQLVGIRLDAESPVIGATLTEVAGRLPKHPFRVAAIVRGFRTIVPHGKDTLRRNDQVFVAARPKDVPHVVRLMGKDEGKIQSVMILGGTELGVHIARQLGSEKSKRIKLVESSRERAQQCANELPGTLVIHGKNTDIDLLATEGLAEMDAFVAVTDDEESNLVTCLLAKHLGVRKTVALLSKVAYIPISQSIGLDAAVSTKLAISREIMRFLRGKHVHNAATIHGVDAEILEIEAAEGSPVTTADIASLGLPRGIVIVGVHHGKKAEVATGRTRVNAGDRAIVFVLPSRIAEAERVFAAA